MAKLSQQDMRLLCEGELFLRKAVVEFNASDNEHVALERLAIAIDGALSRMSSLIANQHAYTERASKRTCTQIQEHLLAIHGHPPEEKGFQDFMGKILSGRSE